MAAGIGSRFGGGIKQLEPVGPNGEIIMDYSIHDALEAGFNKIVFIIRKDLDKDFREIIGNRIEKIADVAYAYQELNNLPDGFTKPADRTKPWGTGQAILVCQDIVKEPFAVINADDYYGKEAFVKIHDYLITMQPSKDKFNFCMAGFILGNTLSDNGSVTRGICEIDSENHLLNVNETHDIIKTEDGAAVMNADGTAAPLDPQSHVSMNMWGFTPDLFPVLEEGFIEFLGSLSADDLKKEYLLPVIADQLIKDGRAQVTLLETNDKWFGVTYKEDKASVTAAIKDLIEEGFYPAKLFS